MKDNQNETDVENVQQEEALEQEDAVETESWQDELPPDDDFHDQEEPLEDSADEPVGEEVQDDGREKAKRGTAILLGAMAVGAVFIGGLAYLQFSSGDETGGGPIPVAQVMDVNALRKKDGTVQQPVAAQQPSSVVQGTTDIANLYQTDQQPASKTALPTGDSPEIGAEKPIQGMTTEILSTSAETAATNAAATVAPSLDKKQAPQVAKIETIPVPQDSVESMMAPPPLPVSLGTAPSQASAAATAEAEARIKTLTEQIDTLQKAMDQATQKNTELLAQIEIMQKTVPSPSSDALLQEKVNQLEAKLAAREEEIKKSKQADLVPASINLGPAVTDVVPVETAKTKEVSDAPKKASVKKTVKKKAAVRTQTAASSKASTGWVLRAATPDAAWVSAGRDSQELRRVAVGEELPGIGMVKEIRQAGDQWELVGDKGSLK